MKPYTGCCLSFFLSGKNPQCNESTFTAARFHALAILHWVSTPHATRPLVLRKVEKKNEFEGTALSLEARDWAM